MLPALVIATGDAAQVEAEHVAGAGLAPGMAALFKTRNGALSRERFSTDFASITPAAAQALVDAGASLAGIDYLSVDPADSTEAPAHHILLGAGLLILEDADLRAVEPGRYTLMCFPLRLHQTEASPVRAVLLRN
jgi:arylformamidase